MTQHFKNTILQLLLLFIIIMIDLKKKLNTVEQWYNYICTVNTVCTQCNIFFYFIFIFILFYFILREELLVFYILHNFFLKSIENKYFGIFFLAAIYYLFVSKKSCTDADGNPN